ncbi:MAG TPA: hypothetical protein PLZ55_02085 [bacterium]|nr:hypothetical protein [bacterium]
MKMHRLCFSMAGILVVFGCLGVASAQVSLLQGAWIVDDGIDGTEFGPATINAIGVMSFAEVSTYADEEIGTYVFDITYNGMITYGTDRKFAYGGIGVGVARNTGGTVQVHFDVVAAGIGSTDNNMLAGVWTSPGTLTTPQGQFDVAISRPILLIREGYDPGNPGEDLAGTWSITITGANFEWSGEITLNPDGTMMGETGAGLVPPVPLAGFFTYSETKQFNFTYTTTQTLPVLGETTFTLTGQGQGNEDNTEINGTWSFTVQVTDRQSQTFEGTFSLVKIADSSVGYWDLY